MCDIVILAEDAPHVTPAHEDGTTTIVPLNAGFFTKVGSDCIDFRLLSDEAHACLLVPVYATFSRT